MTGKCKLSKPYPHVFTYVVLYNNSIITYTHFKQKYFSKSILYNDFHKAEKELLKNGDATIDISHNDIRKIILGN